MTSHRLTVAITNTFSWAFSLFFPISRTYLSPFPFFRKKKRMLPVDILQIEFWKKYCNKMRSKSIRPLMSKEKFCRCEVVKADSQIAVSRNRQARPKADLRYVYLCLRRIRILPFKQASWLSYMSYTVYWQNVLYVL